MDARLAFRHVQFGAKRPESKQNDSHAQPAHQRSKHPADCPHYHAEREQNSKVDEHPRGPLYLQTANEALGHEKHREARTDHLDPVPEGRRNHSLDGEEHRQEENQHKREDMRQSDHFCFG